MGKENLNGFEIGSMPYGGATTEGKSALVKILARASCYDVMLFTSMEDIEAVNVRCPMDFTYNGSRERERTMPGSG